jgi:hypothetical protein
MWDPVSKLTEDFEASLVSSEGNPHQYIEFGAVDGTREPSMNNARPFQNSAATTTIRYTEDLSDQPEIAAPGFKRRDGPTLTLTLE